MTHYTKGPMTTLNYVCVRHMPTMVTTMLDLNEVFGCIWDIL